MSCVYEPLGVMGAGGTDHAKHRFGAARAADFAKMLQSVEEEMS